MITSPDEVVARARALVGAPFKPQGRHPQTGLDCVGLALWAFGFPPEAVRRNYRLSGEYFEEIQRELERRFSRTTDHKGRAGDLLLCRVSQRQAHVAISCGPSFVHSDARLRCVVETPGPPPWAIIAAFRLNQKQIPG
jgi:cell wall-associated NlpC family hydrolase